MYISPVDLALDETIHVAICARWRHRWCRLQSQRGGLSFSFSFEVHSRRVLDCAHFDNATRVVNPALIAPPCIRGYRFSLVRGESLRMFAIMTFLSSSSSDARFRCFFPCTHIHVYIFSLREHANNIYPSCYKNCTSLERYNIHPAR